MPTQADDQAFPRNYAYQNPQAGQSELKSFPGLTKKELFSALAMQGMLIVGKGFDLGTSTADIAKASVQMADALIEALNKQEAKP